MTDKYQALPAYLRERADAPFVWGENDCFTLAADWVLIATGRDPMRDIRGTYSDELAASLALEAGGGVARLVTSRLGIPLLTVTTAQRGDVILFESGNGPALGICAGATFAALKPPTGLGYFSMRHALTAWRVA